MILAVMFMLAGAVAFLFAIAVLLSGNASLPALLASLPVFVSSLAMFGIAQIIHVMIRTAEASEAMLAEMRQMRQQTAAVGTVRCPLCHSDNPVGNKKCSRCGNDLHP